MVTLEEERFRSTLTVGLNKLDELFASTKGEMPEYKALARLYDTFGTPRDLIRVDSKSVDS
jgi:alanyl-tRNA synthetase